MAVFSVLAAFVMHKDFGSWQTGLTGQSPQPASVGFFTPAARSVTPAPYISTPARPILIPRSSPRPMAIGHPLPLSGLSHPSGWHFFGRLMHNDDFSRGQVHALMAATFALIETHPDKAALLPRLALNLELVAAKALSSAVSDAHIDGVEDMAERVIRYAKGSAAKEAPVGRIAEAKLT